MLVWENYIFPQLLTSLVYFKLVFVSICILFNFITQNLKQKLIKFEWENTKCIYWVELIIDGFKSTGCLK